jgi:hypothetical protein
MSRRRTQPRGTNHERCKNQHDLKLVYGEVSVYYFFWVVLSIKLQGLKQLHRNLLRLQLAGWSFHALHCCENSRFDTFALLTYTTPGYYTRQEDSVAILWMGQLRTPSLVGMGPSSFIPSLGFAAFGQTMSA